MEVDEVGGGAVELKLLFSRRSSVNLGFSEGLGDKSWRKGCSSLIGHRAPGSFSVLTAQELLCHPELIGEARATATQPGRLL